MYHQVLIYFLLGSSLIASVASCGIAIPYNYAISWCHIWLTSLLPPLFPWQGGENRRILLDLKTVLEEVQLEVKREEEKRSELQLQYTRDRCAWELEKAELKCRIAQVG